MTLLTMTNNVQDILSLPRSSVVVSSTDQNVRLLLALANQEGRELARRYGWESLLTEKTFTSTATAAQSGAIPADYDRIVNGSMFNRTQTRRVTGPLNAREWQAQQALAVSLLTDTFRIQGGAIYLEPVPPAGDTYAYEYVSKYWVDTDADGVGEAATWQADTDTGVLDEALIELGLIWRFRKARGFDYAEEFSTYEREVLQAMMRDGGKRVLNYSMDDSLATENRPPLIPEGSWSL